MQSDKKRIAVRICGRVQGVGFRWFVMGAAERLGLRGWVRNAANGDVELEAEGPADAIAQFRAMIEKGPPAARVSHVIDMTASNYDLPQTFEIAR